MIPMNEPDLFPTGRNYKFIGLYFDPFDAPRQLMALFFTPHACHSEQNLRVRRICEMRDLPEQAGI
jgi:hypothetical protein